MRKFTQSTSHLPPGNFWPRTTAIVHSAEIQDRDSAHGGQRHSLQLPVAAPCVRRWRICRAQTQAGADKTGDWTIEIIKRSDHAKGFIDLARRWVVEQTFAWLDRNRRLAKNFEHTIASATVWIFMTSVQLLTRRIAKP